MKRWALNTVSAISLFLFIAIAGMWVRSYFVSDRLTWPNPNFKPPPAHPTIIYGEGHVDWRPSAEASSELQYAGILVIQGSRVLNSGLGVVEFVIDSPPWRQIGWDPLESTCRHASLSIL